MKGFSAVDENKERDTAADQDAAAIFAKRVVDDQRWTGGQKEEPKGNRWTKCR